MKKFKNAVIAVAVFLVVSVGSVYAASLWRGSDNVEGIKSNLELIQVKMNELEDENGDSKETIREIEILLEQEKALREQRERELADKQTEIENKIAEIQEKIAENNRLKDELAKAIQKAQKVDKLEAEVDKLEAELSKVTADRDGLESELKQALKDVQDIERITDGMVQ